jgi:hemerythrin-like domain-containing protein
MRYQFYREHKYVSASLNDLERLIARVDFCHPEAVHEVHTHFDALADMLTAHAEYENERLHLLLKQKNVPESLYGHVEEEHVSQEQQLLEIQHILQSISQQPSDEKKTEEGHRLYLIYRKFVADSLEHLHEEETVILPELQRLYSDAELQQIEAATYREMTPEQMVDMIQVLFPHMNPHDKKAFLSDIQALEPEKFAVVHSSLGSMMQPE